MESKTGTAMSFGSAISRRLDAAQAAAQIIGQLEAGDLRGADWLTIFSTRHHAANLTAIRDQLREALEPKLMIAASASGVIGQRRELEQAQPGLTALAGRMPGAKLVPFRFDYADWPHVIDSPTALSEAIPLGSHTAQPKAVFLLAEARTTPILRLLQAFDQQFPETPVIGGLLNAGPHPRHTHLCIDGRDQTFGAVGVAMGGAIRVACSISQGCRAIGRPLVVTQARGQVIEQLAGRKALGVIRQIVAALEKRDQTLIYEHGLHIGRVVDEYRPRFGRHDFLIRSLTEVNERTGAVTVGDRQIAVGQTVQLQVRDPAVAQDDFAMALQTQKLHGAGRGGLMLSCAGRGSRLFDQPHTDIRQVNEALGPMPVAGAFMAGQFTRVAGRNVVQGHAASLAVFRSSYDMAADTGEDRF